MPATDQIRRKVSELPHKPGIYLMKDRFGTVVYVGKARDLCIGSRRDFDAGRRVRVNPTLVHGYPSHSRGGNNRFQRVGRAGAAQHRAG